MKIAVPFANGEVFQHFGHTEHFKLYEIEAGQVVSSQIWARGALRFKALWPLCWAGLPAVPGPWGKVGSSKGDTLL